MKMKKAIIDEINAKSFRYKAEGKLALFDRIMAYQGIICKKVENEKYQVQDIF